MNFFIVQFMLHTPLDKSLYGLARYIMEITSQALHTGAVAKCLCANKSLFNLKQKQALSIYK